MKMKLVAVAFFVASALLSPVLNAGVILPVFLAGAFAAYGVAASLSRHLDPLNDIPNALRVFLASLGGLFVSLSGGFFYPAGGVLLLFAAVYLNDEFQRRAFAATSSGRRGGSVAILGIDGAGKSSHSTVTGRWLEARGYRCVVMPFHRYIFMERLPSLRRATAESGADGSGVPGRYRFRRGGNRLRPLASLLDNLVLQVSSSLGCRLEGTVVVYDRFIWSTYVKYKALGYPVGPISALYLSPRPTCAIVLDIPVERSLRVIDERVAHIHYPGEVLAAEREEYLRIARERGYPVVDSTASFDSVQRAIESHLEARFPRGGKGGGPR